MLCKLPSVIFTTRVGRSFSPFCSGEKSSLGNRLQQVFFLPTEQNSLGGKVRIMVTGAAPISAPVLTFLRAAMGCPVSQAPLKTADFPLATNKAHCLNKMENTTEKYQRGSHPKISKSGEIILLATLYASKILVKLCPISITPCQRKIYIILMVLE